MARYEPQVVTLDKRSVDAINQLTKAIAEQNRLSQRAEKRELSDRRDSERATAVRLQEPVTGGVALMDHVEDLMPLRDLEFGAVFDAATAHGRLGYEDSVTSPTYETS